MSLWGKNPDAIDNKPKWTSTDENSPYKKADVYATNSGWVRRAGTAASGNGNVNADPEVLVAIRGLAGVSATTGLKAPTISSINFVQSSIAAGSRTISVNVTYDEAVTVTGTPTVTVANGDESGTNGSAFTHTLSYVSGSSTANRLRFSVASQTVGATDVLTFGGASQADIQLPGGATITDTADGSTAASVDLTGLTAVTLTVTA